MNYTPLIIDTEIGMATYALPALDALIEKLQATAVHVDNEHAVYLLCKHPITGVVDFYEVADLMDPQSEKAPPKLAKV